MKNKIIFLSLLIILATLIIFPMGMSAQAACDTLPTGEQPFEPNGFGEYLTEYYTGEVLYQYNADAKHEIASMVKIMTANLIFQAIDEGKLSYDEMICISANASSMGGSQMFLDTGENYSVNDLLKGIIVVSANDAS